MYQFYNRTIEHKKTLIERKMELDITSFLPKYPNIKQLEDEILNPYGDDFYEAIYRKKEFYDNRLEATEKFPENVGTLMKHQKLIARFFSSHTLYDELLVIHEMGTGKSCSAVGAIEQIRAEGGGFRGALYLAKGDALINNFVNELIFKCTDGRYVPEDYEKLTELEKVHRKKKAIRDYYSTNTFETFAKDIRKSNDEALREKYNNRIIIIDEVHNLRIQKEVDPKRRKKVKDKKPGLHTYRQFWRFLHVVQDCKILLMSGTPMKDGVDEIASVMNLILPVDRQLPTSTDFTDEFFNQEGDEMFRVKPSKVNQLKDLFKGRVSYLKAMQSDIKKVFAGDPTGALRHFNVVDDYMDEFQTKYYDKAFEQDRSDHEGVYANSRQAALFVYPDGSWGTTGFAKYIKKSRLGSILGDDGKKKAKYTFSLLPELRKAIYASTHEEMLDKLSKLSSKYAASIRNILQAQKDGKSVFLYNEFVTGSGLILFGAILELFGFSKASGNEGQGAERPRYASLTNETATTKQIRQLVERFNQPDNMHGKIINVIMGSRKIAEGFSLSNVQVEEIQTPWFNYSETAQAIARGYRLGSHRMLLAVGETPQVVIYQRVSIPASDFPSIDLEMYEIAEDKDISIKGVERLMKEAAWDCALAYARNHVTGYDGQRECDYMDCDYTCDGVPADMIALGIPNSDLDYSTFQLYYAHPNVRQIIDQIVLLFRDHFRMDLESIVDYFQDYSGFELITALRTMINESTQVTNKYGYPSYVKEENNIFFLVDSLSVVGRFSSDYYTEYPHVKKPTTFAKVVKPLYFDSLPNIVQESCNATTIEDIRKIMIRLPLEAQEFFIEAGILSRKKGIEKNANARALILEYFDTYFAELDDVWVSWLLYDDQEIMRCLHGDTWEDCREEYVTRVEEHRKQIQAGLEQNPYGYYGQYNPETKDFCIRDVSDDIPDKKHKRTSGRRCTDWNKTELAKLAISVLKLPIPNEADMDKKETGKWQKAMRDKNKLWRELAQKGHLREIFASMNKNDMATEDLNRVLFWGMQQKKPICQYLFEWFTAEGLMVEDRGCGVMGKPKI